MTNLIIISLAIIAAIVACGLSRKRNMWHWIVVYWLVLTIKNLLDYITTK
jgi:hypothetical protein